MIGRKLRWISYPAAFVLGSAVLAPPAGAGCGAVNAYTSKINYSIWSGVIIQDALKRFANPNDAGLYGQWTVPTFTAANYPAGRCDGKDQKVAQWTGYDGTGGLAILQAGTYENVRCSLGENATIKNFQATYQPFWQWAGNPHYFTLPFSLPGNVIRVNISYCPTGCLSSSGPPKHSSNGIMRLLRQIPSPIIK